MEAGWVLKGPCPPKSALVHKNSRFWGHLFFFFVLSFEIQAYTNILSPVLEIGRRKAALVGGETVKGLFS